jgi:hypothetical protein
MCSYKRRSPMPVTEGGTGAQTLTGVLTGNGTSAITANAVTQYNVIVGGASNAVGSVSPSATTGVPLVSQGAAANPAFGTAVVAGGGTGIVTTTAYAPICGGTTATGAFQAASTGLSTSGYVLTSNGASALPSFQALPASGISTINGDTGSVTGSTVSIKGNGPTGAGQTVKFSGSGTAMSLAASDVSNNTLIGLNNGTATPGSNNTGVGAFVLNTLDGTGTDNTALGVAALRFLTSGDFNTAIGDSSLGAITSGSRNTCIGFQTAGSYTSSEGSNILIGFQTLGTAGESNKLRIGNATGTGNGNLNAAYIAGITGITTGGASSVTMIDSSNQIGTVPGGAVTLNTGTQSLSLSSDASATTVNVGTGAAAKTVTLGSTNSTSSLALKYGTSDFTLASATGTVMSALDTGEITYPLQPAFLAYLGSIDSNVTGNGTAYTLGSVTALTEVFDQNGDFNTNGTFTAPVTGKYQLEAGSLVIGCTIASGYNQTFITSNRSYLFQSQRAAGASNFGLSGQCLADMDAGDTFTLTINVTGEAGNTDDIYGDTFPATFMAGYLAC